MLGIEYQAGPYRTTEGAGRPWKNRAYLPVGLGVLVLAGGGSATAWAQFTERIGADDRFLSRTAPYLPEGGAEETDYNIKWHQATARLRGSVQLEWSDNVTLNDRSTAGDAFVNPNLGVGIFWPLSRLNVLRFDLAAGYRYYARFSRLSSFYISPSSHLEYRMIIGQLRLNVHDDFSIQVDPVSRPEISGVNRGDPILFRRFQNTSGISASLQPAEHWSLVAGYDYSLDRSMADDFVSIDHDTHLFSGAVFRSMPPQWTVGWRGSYSITDYRLAIQNDGNGFNTGPLAAFQATEHLLLETGVSWSESWFDQSGSITDRSDFRGMTFHAGVQHAFNSRAQHHLRVSKAVDLGLGSNYTDLTAVQYGLGATVRRGVTLNTILAYDHFRVSGTAGETADRYLFYAGSGIALSRQWWMGLGYSLALKQSDQANRDYLQNRVTGDFSYKF